MSSDMEAFQNNVEAIDKDKLFALMLCGPESICVGAIKECLQPPAEQGMSLASTFLNSLDKLDRQFSQRASLKKGGDETIPRRWEALSVSLRWLLDKGNQGLRGRAVECLDEYWRECESHSQAIGPADVKTPPFDKSPGEYILEDFQNQIDEKKASRSGRDETVPAIEKIGDQRILTEKTPVLFGCVGGSGGLALRLVVEALPGPPGLVTPNHFKLGLIPFPIPSGHPERHLPAAIQRIMRVAILQDAVSLRLRWHFEDVNPEALKTLFGEAAKERTADKSFPLVGRSVEAAAVCAVMAIAERYHDWRKPPVDQHDKTVRRVNPMLDEQVAVTGSVTYRRDLPLATWRIGPVSPGTLRNKFIAAKKATIDTVCLAKQEVAADDSKIVSTLQFVETVQDAYQVLDNYQDILDRYREHVRSQFIMREEDTPTTP